MGGNGPMLDRLGANALKLEGECGRKCGDYEGRCCREGRIVNRGLSREESSRKEGNEGWRYCVLAVGSEWRFMLTRCCVRIADPLW